MANISRRHLLAGLGIAGFASSLGGLNRLGYSNAWAANTSGYKAMVCIFLKGGMDQSDTIIPYDTTSYNQLSQVRSGLFDSYSASSGTSSRNRANLLKLNPTNASALGGREFAMPQQLAPLHGMFENGELAIVGNVGPLLEPTTRAQMDNGSVIIPKRLFSHNDQQSTWMSLGVEGSSRGWGGRFLDMALASAPGDDPVFAAITTSANDVFLAGQTARQFRVSANGVPDVALLSREWYLGYSDADDRARQKIREFVAKNDLQNPNIFEQDMVRANSRAVENSSRFAGARQNAGPLTTTFANDPVSKQLQAVAETMKIQQYLNVSRQMFYVAVNGFDTHSSQTSTLSGLHSALANGIASFRQAMLEIGHWDDVVVFTASDFGRTLIDNGNGTDHGWGGHHIVAGGQVRGKRFYGELPNMDADGPAYTKSRGRLIPSVSVEQYAATLGSWFGLNQTELRTVLPNLGNFNTSDLGFMDGSTA